MNITIGDKIKAIRKNANMTQEVFGNKIKSARNTIANYESGNRIPSDTVIHAICQEFSVDEEWLKNGLDINPVYRPIEDETAAYVSELLENRSDPVYDLIKGIMKTYVSLGGKEKIVIKSFAESLISNLKDGN